MNVESIREDNTNVNRSSSAAIGQAALDYLSIGYSVIPVFMSGDSRDKHPRGFNDNYLQWGIFQKQHATREIIQAWQDNHLFSDGIAIITGEISNLLVLDFDDYALAEDFIETFPELTNTYRVSTQRGIHFYFKPDTELAPISQQLANIDIQWNGRYVVAAPTPGYKILSNEHPIKLSKSDYHRIIRRYASSDQQQTTEANKYNRIPSLKELISIYSRNTSRGRNNSLFEIVKLARDFGYMPNDLITAGLQDAFVYTPATADRVEKPLSRMKEYTRTVSSVYSRKARKLNQDLESLSVSDEAREILHINGQSATSRVIDAILTKFPARTHVTMKDLYRSFEGVIDWKVIRAALDATFNGKLFFERAPLSPRPSPQRGKAGKDTTKNAFSGVKKTEKIKSGRRPRKFIVPSANDIQRITGAQKRTSTAIEPDTLASPKDYRIRLHIGRIERTKHYLWHSNKWLANCLDVCVRTIQNYNTIAGIYKRENYIFLKQITWQSLQALDVLELSQAHFISDERGRNYPPKASIAARLLSAGRSLMLRVQGSNYYSTTLNNSPSKPQSKSFTNDLNDIMKRYTAGQRGDSLNSIQRQEIPNAKLYQNMADYWQSFKVSKMTVIEDEQKPQFPAPPSNEIGDKWQWLGAWSQHMNAMYDLLSNDGFEGIQGISEPSPKAIKNRRVNAAQNDAKTLTMLIPNRTLSHQKAVDLIVSYGAERCLQEAMKIVTEYHFGRDRKRAIKNPVGVLIYRLALKDS